uniref:Metallo-beta-lactamase domain-containing protein n=1 Tax=Opuntia streptacantha TaxID=393608 RepID=A0A7C8ZK60_OPUST
MCHLIYATTVNLCHLVPSTMAASRCSVSLHSQYFPRCGRRAKPCSPHLCNIIPLGHASLSSSSCFSLSCSCSLQTLNFSPRNRGRRLGTAMSALISEESATESASSSTDSFKLTYLEGNSWLWEVGGVKLLVDPILVGTLDFGIPWLYDAAKKFLKNFQLSDLPDVDGLLITQSLDDHCHLKTLKPLSAKFPNLRVVATPNARAKLDPFFSTVTYLEPGQNTEIEGRNGSKVRIRATAGPVLGPPWQRPENGYIISSAEGRLTLYYEPHCVYNEELLKGERADIVITPVIKQLLPNFTLVSGQEDAVKLAKLLRARFVVPMKNGDLDSKGLLAAIIKAEGTVESFKELLSKELPDAKLLEPTPGVPLEVTAP